MRVLRSKNHAVFDLSWVSVVVEFGSERLASLCVSEADRVIMAMDELQTEGFLTTGRRTYL